MAGASKPSTILDFPKRPFVLSLSKDVPFFLNPPMPFWTYMLYCGDRSFYVGQTDDLEKRIAAHEAGGMSDYTARRLPVRLVWSQAFGTRAEALEAERQIKGWSRAKKLALIRGDWALISSLARKPQDR